MILHELYFAGLDMRMKRYAPLPPEQLERLMTRIAKRHPRLLSPLAVFPVSTDDITAYEKDYGTWLGSVRNRLTNLHLDWNRRREWPEVWLMAVNIRIFGGDEAGIGGRIVGRVSAANLSVPVEHDILICIVFEDRATGTIAESMVHVLTCV